MYEYNEPTTQSWKCICSLDNNIYSDYYDNIITPYKTNWGLFIEKLQNGYYLYNNEFTFLNNYTQYEKSSVFFLSITLIQNNLIININLKKNEYIVGNNLLSKIHIIRYIKYNNIWNNIFFDINIPYKIEIIDSKMNKIEINEKQCILLDKHKFVVMPTC
jgi:hypothetical protein